LKNFKKILKITQLIEFISVMIVSKYEMSIESVFLCVSTLVTSISAFVCSNFKCFKRLLVERKNTEPAKNKKKQRRKTTICGNCKGKPKVPGKVPRWRNRDGERKRKGRSTA